MKYLILVFCFALLKPMQTEAAPKDSITVYVFLLDACVICQNYTLPLKELHAKYANDQVNFVGLFPNFTSKPPQIEAFKKKYQIPFELKTDYFKTKSKQFGITVTPEVVVYNHTKEEVLYKGRIDNTYFRVGKRRTITTTSELEDALEAIKNGQPIKVKETEAVGCFINYNEGPKIEKPKLK